MTTIVVPIRLAPQVARWLDQYAAQVGHDSRSAAIRALIERELRATGYPIEEGR